MYEPGVPSCDYYLHGWQTVSGDWRNQLVDYSGKYKIALSPHT